MKVYIRASGNISPQHSLDRNLFFSIRKETSTNFLNCVEPDYSAFIDDKMIRRMSRVIKMGVAASITCLRNAGLENPAAILTATAYGCLEDSSAFLRRMIEYEEKMLSPTAFIQSTHNTVGAQIALLLKCHNYNNTIVHRAFSFENALTESGLLLQEGVSPVLVGAVDENTEDRHLILSRFGMYKKKSGNIAGEGAAFFLLDKEPGDTYQAVLKDVQTLYQKPKPDDMIAFLDKNNISPSQLGLVLHAHGGAINPANQVWKKAFAGVPEYSYSTLCGDYPTSTGFALWFACLLLKEQQKPDWLKGIELPLKNIFIHRQDGLHQSFYLISSS